MPPPLQEISATETAAVDWSLWTNKSGTRKNSLNADCDKDSIMINKQKSNIILHVSNSFYPEECYFFRNYIIIGVASLNLGCNSILTDSGEKLPSVFADIRGQSVMGWIEDQITGATFCRRSDQVHEVKGGKMW